jgi:hypothetical protein
MDTNKKYVLKDNLMKLSKYQLKLFYGMLVHYWAEYRFFISKQNLFNLWCELNYLCYEVDESFPDPYDDHELLKSYCHEHPYYFIDILDPELVINLFCEYLDDRIDVLAMVANKLSTEGLKAAYERSNEALGLSENVEELVTEAEEHVKMFS